MSCEWQPQAGFLSEVIRFPHVHSQQTQNSSQVRGKCRPKQHLKLPLHPKQSAIGYSQGFQLLQRRQQQNQSKASAMSGMLCKHFYKMNTSGCAAHIYPTSVMAKCNSLSTNSKNKNRALEPGFYNSRRGAS